MLIMSFFNADDFFRKLFTLNASAQLSLNACLDNKVNDEINIKIMLKFKWNPS